MIHLAQSPGAKDPLTPAERHGLSVLLDLSRLVQADRPDHAVRIDVTPSPSDTNIARCISDKWNFQPGDGVVAVPRAVLRVVTEIVGAVDEQRSEQRDRYGRVPAGDNALVRHGVADEPVISRAALFLRQAVARAAGRRRMLLVRPWPQGHRWAAAVTHDLDVVAWWPGFTLLRLLELVGKGRVDLAAQVSVAALGSTLRNPVERAIRSVLAIESRLAVPSTWFILCGTPSAASMAAGDLTYRPESSRAQGILENVEKAGNELALHGSFASYDRLAVFQEQRSRLAKLSRVPASGVRQHFLRMVPGATQSAMADAGFGYDSTFGFADRNGFRLGVGDVVPAWDERGQRTLAIEEAPFTWMDRALSKYRGIEDPRAWVDDGLRVADRVRESQGLWVGIWHPNLDTPLGYPRALQGFQLLINRLADQTPYFTTLGNAVAWRAARRQARVKGVRADGVPELAAPRSAAGDIEAESIDGSPVQIDRVAT